MQDCDYPVYMGIYVCMHLCLCEHVLARINPLSVSYVVYYLEQCEITPITYAAIMTF